MFARTHGQPLFIVSLIDHLVAQGVITESEGSWDLTSEQAITQDDMPRDLHQMLLRQVDRLTAHEQNYWRRQARPAPSSRLWRSRER